MKESNTTLDVKASLITFTINDPAVDKEFKQYLRDTAIKALPPLLAGYIFFMILHIYTVATEGELGIYFLIRNIIATIMILLAFMCG